MIYMKNSHLFLHNLEQTEYLCFKFSDHIFGLEATKDQSFKFMYEHVPGLNGFMLANLTMSMSTLKMILV